MINNVLPVAVIPFNSILMLILVVLFAPDISILINTSPDDSNPLKVADEN